MVAPLLIVRLPTKSTDGDGPGNRLGEVRNQWRARLDAQQADLAGCLQVEPLEEVNRGSEEGDGNPEVLREDRKYDQLDRTRHRSCG